MNQNSIKNDEVKKGEKINFRNFAGLKIIKKVNKASGKR